jgi:hypothetical protein
MAEEELEFVDAGTARAQRWHRRVTHLPIVKVAVIAAVVLGILAQLHAHIDARVRRSRLIREAETDRRDHPQAAAMIDALDRATLDLAADTFGGPLSRLDVTALDKLVAERGLYLRAVREEVRSPRAIHRAALVSRKDTFLGCLLDPPRETTHAAVHAAAIRHRWRVDLDRLAPHVLDVELLDAGFRVAAASFIDEARATTDPMSLRLLDHERTARTAQHVRHGVEASRAQYLAIVLDELPTGLAQATGPAIVEALRPTLIDEVLPTPHAVRVALVTPRGDVLLRIRTTVDARDLTVPNVLADAEEVHACQAALAVRAIAAP